MKKILFTILILCISISTFAQENQQPLGKHEIKLNILYSVFGLPEITYEYALGEDSAVGLSVLFRVDKDIANKFAATPYYRYYFGKKPTAGFFVEGFGMFTIEEIPNKEDAKDLALGATVGWKFLSKKGFVGEINAGLGINMFGNHSVDGIPRVGLTFGKRF